MAGHLAGLGYSQRFDANGDPLAGAKLYIYESGTSTPASVFQDYALGIAHTFPIEADSAGIIPMFWVDDGTYRVRLTDVDGNEIFDDNGIVALGPSSGSGGASSVDANALFQTGDFIWIPISGTRTGWVRANARTIGSAASGATERASADCESLFTYLWTNYTDSLCPVTGGRGGSAAADWSANKVIATLDMRSKGALGDDGMGNTNAGITGGSTVVAAAVGASTYTIALANLPSTTLSSTALVATPTDTRVYTFSQRSTSAAQAFASGGGGVGALDTDANKSITMSTPNSGTLTVAMTGTIPLGGSDTDMDILTPSRIGSWYIKL